MICNRPEDVHTDWVFGYGSLIWNPEFEYESADLARAHGYHRAFCVRSTLYRGTPQRPGVVLGLDRGGSCVGVAYRLPPATRMRAIEGLFLREIPDPSIAIYVPRIIDIRLSDGSAQQALTFVADRAKPSYQRLSDAEILERLMLCHGMRGANRDYAVNTFEALQARGVFDARLQRVIRQLGPLQAPAPPHSQEAAASAAAVPQVAQGGAELAASR
ncbi:MAG TPA: gamma-glutamylcyclotransferase [Burkholderiaceae bacterium]|nr:gamma-glutamylcyclotransferase [Burkholderiaceae bacterium]